MPHKQLTDLAAQRSLATAAVGDRPVRHALAVHWSIEAPCRWSLPPESITAICKGAAPDSGVGPPHKLQLPDRMTALPSQVLTMQSTRAHPAAGPRPKKPLGAVLAPANLDGRLVCHLPVVPGHLQAETGLSSAHTTHRWRMQAQQSDCSLDRPEGCKQRAASTVPHLQSG